MRPFFDQNPAPLVSVRPIGPRVASTARVANSVSSGCCREEVGVHGKEFCCWRHARSLPTGSRLKRDLSRLRISSWVVVIAPSPTVSPDDLDVVADRLRDLSRLRILSQRLLVRTQPPLTWKSTRPRRRTKLESRSEGQRWRSFPSVQHSPLDDLQLLVHQAQLCPEDMRRGRDLEAQLRLTCVEHQSARRELIVNEVAVRLEPLELIEISPSSFARAFQFRADPTSM